MFKGEALGLYIHEYASAPETLELPAPPHSRCPLRPSPISTLHWCPGASQGQPCMHGRRCLVGYLCSHGPVGNYRRV